MKSEFTGVKKPCPTCQADGRDKSGDNLRMREDGTGYCFACSTNVRAEGEPVLSSSAAPAKSEVRVSDINSLPLGSDPIRKVSEKVTEAYGVRVGFDEVTGTVSRVHYPYYELNKVSGYKIRTLPKTFFASGTIGGLFKPKEIPEFPKGNLFITEGEEDALAVATMLELLKQENHIVTSVATGTSVDRSIMADLDLIKKFRKIYVWMDSDVPGETARNHLCDILSPEVKALAVIQTPGGYKDASDILQAGALKEFWDAVTHPDYYEPEGVVDGADVDIADLMRASTKGYECPYPGLQAKLHGFRKAEITTLCAGSGIGKTTFAKEVGLHMVKAHGLTVCHIPLEDLVRTTQQAYVGLDNNIPFAVLRSNPMALPVAEWERSKEEVLSKMYFFKHHGSLDPDALMRRIEYYVNVKGVDFIILDHLSMVVSGLDVQNERKAIDMIMTRLAEIVVRTGVGLIQIVHLKRRDADTGFGEGGKPQLSDLRGSASLEQISWNVIALSRDQQGDDGSEDYVKVWLLKNREWGRTGYCDTLRYDHATGRLVISVEDPDLSSTPEPAPTEPKLIAGIGI